MPRMTKAQKLRLSVGAFFLVAATYVYLNYRSSGLDLPIDNLVSMIGGSLGRMVTLQRQDPISAELRNARSLGDAYEKNPNAFSQDAALFETYVNGILVGSRVMKVNAQLPVSSIRFAEELKQS